MYAKLFTAVLCFFQIAAAMAQGTNPFLNDANGHPMYLQTNYKAEGSPYYHEQYSLAEVTSEAGKVYANVNVKVNIQTNEVLYMGDDGKEMIATMPVKRIRFIGFMSEQGASDCVLESFGQPLNTAGTPVYEVIQSGHVTLLKQIKVSYVDSKEFNQSSITRNFQRNESFHLLAANGQVEKISAGKDAIRNLLKDKDAEVAAFIEKNRLKCRGLEDYRKVITYYNTLFQ